ncbi:MAG: glycosyltransferase [Gemmataceae bacterium]|nr:glycosyltransferase [Gemmataceae bacterium]
MKILHLIDSLAYNGSARQLSVLAPALAQGADSVEICCLGTDTPWSAALRQAGVPVHVLGWTRWLDCNVFLRLREILREASPEVIHVWRLPALRALAVVARELLPRVVMSAALPATGKLAWWDRRLLAQVRSVAVGGPGDAARCVRQGIAEPGLRIFPAAVAVPKRGRESFSARSIVCVGKLERETGFRFAIWAFDFLRWLYPDARLRLVGAGSELADLRALAHGLESDAEVQFLGPRADVSDILQDAEIVWIPSEMDTGRQVALEAMALGVPVIASALPSLREIIQDGATGYLVPAGDVVQLARRTKLVFDDADLRQRIGAAGHEFVAQHHHLADVVERWRDLYRSLAA